MRGHLKSKKRLTSLNRSGAAYAAIPIIIGIGYLTAPMNSR